MARSLRLLPLAATLLLLLLPAAQAQGGSRSLGLAPPPPSWPDPSHLSSLGRSGRRQARRRRGAVRGGGAGAAQLPRRQARDMGSGAHPRHAGGARDGLHHPLRADASPGAGGGAGASAGELVGLPDRAAAALIRSCSTASARHQNGCYGTKT